MILSRLMSCSSGGELPVHPPGGVLLANPTRPLILPQVRLLHGRPRLPLPPPPPPPNPPGHPCLSCPPDQVSFFSLFFCVCVLYEGEGGGGGRGEERKRTKVGDVKKQSTNFPVSVSKKKNTHPKKKETTFAKEALIFSLKFLKKPS